MGRGRGVRREGRKVLQSATILYTHVKEQALKINRERPLDFVGFLPPSKEEQSEQQAINIETTPTDKSNNEIVCEPLVVGMDQPCLGITVAFINAKILVSLLSVL